MLPLQRAGMPAERLPELSRSILSLRPAAAKAVSLLFDQVLYQAELGPAPGAHDQRVVRAPVRAVKKGGQARRKPGR